MIAAAFLMSAISVDNTLSIGKNAPTIETIDGIDVVNNLNAEGKTKVINFWNPKKPSSRIALKEISRKFLNDGSDIEIINICTDSDSILMKEVMKIDDMKTSHNYSYSQIDARVFKDYDVENHPRSFMVSSEGKIIDIL